MIILKTRSLFVRYEILIAANINIGDYCPVGVTPYSLVVVYQSFHRNLLLVFFNVDLCYYEYKAAEKNTSRILSHTMLRVEECPESGNITFLRKSATYPTTGRHIPDDVNF